MVARSQNILMQTNAPSQVSAKAKNQTFNHVQVNKVATREGINPFAGDLTNAFNNFFNKANNALSTLQESEFQADKMEAQREAQRRRTIGANDAKEMAASNNYDMNADKAMSSSQSEFAGQYGYSQAFQESYGQAIGGRCCLICRLNLLVLSQKSSRAGRKVGLKRGLAMVLDLRLLTYRYSQLLTNSTNRCVSIRHSRLSRTSVRRL